MITIDIQYLSKNGFFTDENGSVVLVNKPIDWTSFDVVKKVRNKIQKKIGHTGTLDPKAEGLLILLIDKKTKMMDDFNSYEKEYEGTMVLGEKTKSYDSETEVIEKKSIEYLTSEIIKNKFKQFIGEQIQYPPIYSALKVNGRPLYKYAREKKEVEILPRKLFIYDFYSTKIDFPEVGFKVVCSKGTYVRSLVNDFGEALNCGAYLKKLKRTRVGSLRIENAFEIDDIPKIFEKENFVK